MSLYVLFESAAGYSLFERVEGEEIGQELAEVQKSMADLSKFGKVMKLKCFLPFKNAANALENMVSISEGVVHDTLKQFLELNLPKTDRKSKLSLGVYDKALAGSIKQNLGIECVSNELISELCRGIKFHIEKVLKGFKEGDLDKAQLGLGHSYSRAKVKFNVNRSDNMIIQSIALLDQLDKDINTFAMRIKEWYSWHFPELAKIVSDNGQYASLALMIGDKSQLNSEMLPELTEITAEELKSKQILEAARSSMGTDISEIDLLNIKHFAKRVIDLVNYRKVLFEYLNSKMHDIAPNLSSLIGEVVGARLIAHAGSLTNLSKYPASTVQILGAEKALFRALKTRGKTPKYGLIYHSSFIGKAGNNVKGKISRYLANKCSIASRIDCFSDVPTFKFGEAMRSQIEERLKFFETGAVPRKNADVMSTVISSVAQDCVVEDEVVVQHEVAAAEEESPRKKQKKSKEKESKEKDLKEKKEKKKSKK